MSEDAARIVRIEIDQRSIVRWGREVEHERDVAIFDLLEENRFALVGGPEGPYEIMLELRESTLVLKVSAPSGESELVLPTRSLRSLIKDYFLICENYFNAIKGATPSRIEALDMARRALHNEGADGLRELLAARVEVDNQTARRLFTLICVLHVRS